MKKLLLVLFMACFSCSEQVSPKKEYTVVSDISQVLMHEPGHFTFLIDLPNFKVSQLEVRTSRIVTILRDLQPDQSIYISYLCGSELENYSCGPIPADFVFLHVVPAYDLTIHLHSSQEVNGAGWDHGKFGRGSTNVVR